MQYDEDKSQIKSILSYNKIYTYIIFPELDEKGRLHYHGILDLNNTCYTRFHKHAIHKLRQLGFVDISVLKSFENNLRYCIYMMKDWGNTKVILDISYPIIHRRDKAYVNVPKGVQPCVAL